jgi:hypothetical protein
MLKNTIIFILSNLIFVTNANIINRVNDIGVTGRLNNEGITSTTQQLNKDENASMRKLATDSSYDDDVDRKNDNSHFRLFYKANSPDGSVKHELEHRFYKNPNYLANERSQAAKLYQTKFNPFFDLNNFEQNQRYLSNYPPINTLNELDKQTMMNVHFHANGDLGEKNKLSFNKNFFKIHFVYLRSIYDKPTIKKASTTKTTTASITTNS